MVDTNGLYQDAATGRTIAITSPKFVTVSSPLTFITIEHPFPRRHVKVTVYSSDDHLMPEGIVSSLFCGQHSPVVTNEFYVEITFNDPFTGVIRLDY